MLIARLLPRPGEVPRRRDGRAVGRVVVDDYGVMPRVLGLQQSVAGYRTWSTQRR